MLEKTEDDTTKARLLALSHPESGAWLNAFPLAQMGTLLGKTSLRVSISLEAKHANHTNVAVEYYIIKRTLESVGLPSIPEPVGLMREDGKRPDGLMLVSWRKGRYLVCVDTLAPSHIGFTSKTVGAAADSKK
ncbi:hypothetical protein ILUMI_23029 [Ignelater luminosus]|uniref:Uncharacterized protein n=1 Tax=Ignelater luminosus TaxID=2038154 RepID=A0A8K0CCS8_IGNLU|nr:hypothetical protein ILUMI_23029 [Ignelater luminosus]